MFYYPFGMILPDQTPMRAHLIHLRKNDGKWECMRRDFHGATFCTYKVVGNGNTPEQAYFDAYPRTSLQKLRKFLRKVMA